MKRSHPAFVVLCVAVTFSMSACDGSVAPDPVEAGGSANTTAPPAVSGGAATSGTRASTGGTSASGSVGTGGATSSGASTGGAPTGGQPGTVCCMAMAVCDEGSAPITGPAACPVGVTCYSRSICCSTVWCAPELAQCDAYPACDAGDQEITGACPSGQACYSRSLCGNTILCMHPTAACDPNTDLNRKYVSTNTAQCQYLDYLCPANTKMFSNACGCGCEQDPTCPRYIDCMPGPGTRPLMCSDATLCPYTLRAM